MDDAARELRRLMTPAVAWATESEESFFADLALSAEERTIIKAIKDEATRAAEWLSLWRGWAERGTTPTGEPYPVAFYLQVGRDLASAFALYMKEQVHADAFILGQTLTATAGQVGGGVVAVGVAARNVLDGAQDFTEALAAPWSPVAKAAVGAAVVGLIAFTIHTLAAKLPELPRLEASNT